jgi:CubicO group peptidase (beta-lactamase class C family)
MTATRILSEADVIPDRAAGYWLDGNEFKNQEWVSPVNNTTADGSLYWTVLDLAKWADAQRREAVLKPESWRAMTTPVQLNSGKTYPYGFGLAISDWNGKKVIDHGGAWQGFTAHLARHVGEGEIAVAILSNRAGADSGAIARGVMGLYEPEVAVRAFSPIDDPEPAKTAKVKDVLARFVAGGVTRDDFAYLRGGFREGLFDWMKDSLAPLGPLQTLNLLERRELGDDVRLRYRAQFGKGETAEFLIQLTADAKVSAIFMRRPG